MRLVVGEIVVAADGVGYGVEVVSVFNLHVDHAPVHARTHRDRHAQRRAYAFDRLHRHRVPHAHARAKVGVGDALRHDGLQQRTNHGVATRIPSGSHDRHSVVTPSLYVERPTQIGYLGVNIEAVHRANAQRQCGFGVSLDQARRGGQYGHVDSLELL